MYLAGEKEKQEELIELNDHRVNVTNKKVNGIYIELSSLEEAGKLDGYCQYLLGLICRGLEKQGEAKSMYLRAVQSTPCNWSAWVDLASLCSCVEDVDAMILPNHWVKDAFLIHSYLLLDQVCLCVHRRFSFLGLSLYIGKK